MVIGYEFMYVCPKCEAEHLYLPKSGCRNEKCGHPTLTKKKIRGSKVAKTREPKEENVEETQGPKIPNFEIDGFQLENEWKQHPSDYYYWATKQADARGAYDQAVSALEVKKADLSQQIREHPEEYGIPKITEAAISNAIPVQPDCISAQKRVNEARHEMDRAKAVVDSLEHKKRALTMLTELWIKEYYSDPSFKGTSEEAKEFKKEGVRNRGRRRKEDDGDDD